MNDKEAFLLGANLFCKQAGITGEDRDAFVTVVADGNEQVIEGLVKRADPELMLRMLRGVVKGKTPKRGRTLRKGDADRGAQDAAAEQLEQLSPAEARRRVEALPTGGVLGPESLAQIKELLPRVPVTMQRELIQRLSQTAIPEMTPSYGGTDGEWFGGKSWLQRKWYENPSSWSPKEPLAAGYHDTLTTAAMRARELGDWDSYKQLLTRRYASSGTMSLEDAQRKANVAANDARARDAAKPYVPEASSPTPAEAAVAEGAGSAAAAPTVTAGAPATMGDKERKAALEDAQRLLDLRTSTSPEVRAQVLPRFHKALQAAMTSDPELFGQLAARVAGPKEQGGMNLTAAEMDKFAPMLQTIEEGAAKHGNFDVLAKLKTDRMLRKYGVDPGDAEAMSKPFTQRILKDTIAPAVEREVGMMEANWKPPAEADAAETAEEAKRQPLRTMQLDQLKALWDAPEGEMLPDIQRQKALGITAEQYYNTQRMAADTRGHRAQLSTMQSRLGTDYSYKDLAVMSDEDIAGYAGGDPTVRDGFKTMRSLAQRLYQTTNGELPAAAGSPSGEAARSRGTPAEQAAEGLQRTPAGLAMERMKTQEEGGVIQRGEGGGMFAPSSTGGYARGSVEGEGTMPTMAEVRGRQPAAPKTPAEQAVAGESEPAVPAGVEDIIARAQEADEGGPSGVSENMTNDQLLAANPADLTPEQQQTRTQLERYRAAKGKTAPGATGDVNRLAAGYGAGLAGALGGQSGTRGEQPGGFTPEEPARIAPGTGGEEFRQPQTAVERLQGPAALIAERRAAGEPVVQTPLTMGTPQTTPQPTPQEIAAQQATERQQGRVAPPVAPTATARAPAEDAASQLRAIQRQTIRSASPAMARPVAPATRAPVATAPAPAGGGSPAAGGSAAITPGPAAGKHAAMFRNPEHPALAAAQAAAQRASKFGRRPGVT